MDVIASLSDIAKDEINDDKIDVLVSNKNVDCIIVDVENFIFICGNMRQLQISILSFDDFFLIFDQMTTKFFVKRISFIMFIIYVYQ